MLEIAARIALLIGALVLLVVPIFSDRRAGPIRFELSSLPVQLNNHPTDHKYLPEAMAGGLAVFDYDGDGLPDLFFSNGAPIPSLVKQAGLDDNRLFKNEGHLHFRDVTAESGLSGTGFSMGAAAADYDNDGHPDLFVGGVNGGHLYHNQGNGRFVDVTESAGLHLSEWSVSAVWFDYDGDGLLDLFIVDYVAWSPESNPDCREGVNHIPVYCHPDRFKGTTDRLFHNLGNGHFAEVSQASGIANSVGKGMSAIALDYDGDGYADLYVTNDGLPNSLFHNLRDGRFKEVALEAGAALTDNGRPVSSMGVDAADFDHTGAPGLIYTALNGQTFPLFRNLGRGEFQDAGYPSHVAPLTIRRSGWGVQFADFDNDGWLDIIAANSHVTDNISEFSGDVYRQPNSLLRNLGNGVFADVSATAGDAFSNSAAHRGLIAADLDNDGRVDVVISVLGSSPEIWHNTTENSNHWLDVRLRCKTGNRDCLGVRIDVGRQSAWQGSSRSYASSVLGPVHFGLADNNAASTVTIYWPGGKKQTFANVKPDQVVTFEQP